MDIYLKRERTNGYNPRDTPSLGRLFSEPRLITRLVFKIPLKILTPLLLLANELAVRDTLRRRGQLISPSPVFSSSYGYLPIATLGYYASYFYQ